MIGAVGDFVGGVWDEIRNDVTSAASAAAGNVRTDLANAVNDVGASLTTQAAAAIAPPGRAPATVPLSANAITWLALTIVAVLLLILYLAFRRR